RAPRLRLRRDRGRPKGFRAYTGRILAQAPSSHGLSSLWYARVRVASESPVLVVDDDAVSRQLVGEVLVGAGLAVELVSGGAEAIAHLETHPAPSAILLDLVMPPPDGHAVLRHVRSRPALAEVPIVVLTSLDSDEEIRRVFAGGADDYVRKPFRP